MIILQLEPLSYALDVKFFQVMSETIDNDPVLKKYHDMAVKIKADSISNARTSGKILSNIQKCIDDLGRGTRNFPFIAVVGPSLMGKTQLAYILALIQPILYFNFTPTADPQYVYSPFSGLSDAIAQAVRADLSLFKNIGSLGPSQRIIEQEINYKYQVLGCFMAFYEMYAQAFSENLNFDWMTLYAGIETFAYTSMSIHDFCKKRDALIRQYPGMKRPVIFIDEFVKSADHLFLRSLAKTARIPCIIASTNTGVSNMIIYTHTHSRADRNPWCKVIPRLPLCVFDGIVSVLRVSDSVSLSACFDDQLLNGDRLFAHLNVEASESMKRQVGHIFNLIRAQSSTCLQGIAFNAIERLLEILKSYQGEIDVWSRLVSELSRDLAVRKPNLLRLSSLHFSLSSFSLSLPITYSNEPGQYDEGPVNVSVNDNLYYFGRKPQNVEQLYNSIIGLEKVEKLIYGTSENEEFQFKSYLLNFEDDVLTHTVLWNLIRVGALRLHKNIIVARVIELEYNGKYHHINVRSISRNHNYQEDLALLAAANASQQNFKGGVDGVSFFKEFSIQCQIVPTTMEIPSGSLLRDSIITTVPQSLQDFLKDIKIPYFVPQAYTIPYIRPLVHTGICQRNEDRDGVDLSFEIIDRESGHIECKNLNASVARGLAVEYIVKAMKKESPITILLANIAGPSLRSREDFNVFFEPSAPETSEPGIDSAASNLANLSISQSKKKKNKKSKVESKPNRIPHSFVQEIDKKRLSDATIPIDFDLNIYSLVHKYSTGALQLEFNVLHEVPSPRGVFIVLESNSNFCPLPPLHPRIE